MTDTSLRYLSMLRLIPRGPKMITAVELLEKLRAEDHKTSLRTIQRDLNTLSIQFPLISDESKPQGWSWKRDAPQLDIPPLSDDSAIGLIQLQSQLQQSLSQAAYSYLQPWFETARQRLKDTPAQNRAYAKRFRVTSRSFPLMSPKINPLSQARVYEGVLTGTQLSVRYAARYSGVTKEYTVHPLGIVIADTICHLVCTINAHEDVRMLALHRIKDVENTQLLANKPRGFDLDDYLSKGNLGVLQSQKPINLEIRMRNRSAAMLEETPLSTNQKVKTVSDDWKTITATVPDSVQLRSWLKSYGADVEVIRPKSLRDEFCNCTKEQIKFYRDMK